MTILIGVAISRGRTGGKFDLSYQESPMAFGCIVFIWVLATAWFWINVFL